MTTQKSSSNQGNNQGNFANDTKRASEAGRKGGQESPGNFKNDPQRASEAGRKGGENSRRGDQNQ